jgi:hypothetical protein
VTRHEGTGDKGSNTKIWITLRHGEPPELQRDLLNLFHFSSPVLHQPKPPPTAPTALTKTRTTTTEHHGLNGHAGHVRRQLLLSLNRPDDDAIRLPDRPRHAPVLPVLDPVLDGRVRGDLHLPDRPGRPDEGPAGGQGHPRGAVARPRAQPAVRGGQRGQQAAARAEAVARLDGEARRAERERGRGGRGGRGEAEGDREPVEGQCRSAEGGVGYGYRWGWVFAVSFSLPPLLILSTWLESFGWDFIC